MTAAALKLLRAEPHISVSSLTAYCKCPRQFEFRYIRRTQASHRAGALAFGSAVHEAIAYFHEALLHRRPEPTSDDLEQVFRDAWRAQLDQAIPVLFDNDESADSLTDLGTKMMDIFLKNAPRPAEVIEVETPWSIELVDEESGEVLPRLVGVFDAVVRDENGAYRILEMKSGKKKWTADKLAFDPQITAYTIAAPQFGLGDSSVTIQLLTKTKSPAFETYNPTRTDSDRHDFIETAVGVTKAIKAGAFYPVRDWHCRGCQFAGACVAG